MSVKKRKLEKSMKLICVIISLFILSSVSVFAENNDILNQNVTSFNDRLNVASAELTFGELDLEVKSLGIAYISDEKYKKIYVNVKLSNNSKESMGLFLKDMFKIKDEASELYSMEENELDKSFLRVNSNKSVEKKLTFLIPRSVDDMKLVVKANSDTDSSMKLDIGDLIYVFNATDDFSYINSNDKNYIKSEKVSAMFSKTTIEDVEFEITDMMLKIAKKGEHDILTLDINVKNRSDGQIAMTSNTIFSLSDQDGGVYNVFMPETKDSLNGLIDKDESMDGKIVFEIPKAQSKFYLNIKPFMIKDGNASIEIRR